MSDDDAWPLLQGWLREAVNPCRVERATDQHGSDALQGLQGITTRSVLGALARDVAGIRIDGWLNILGAGGPEWPSITAFNAPNASTSIAGALVAGVDVVGGAFVINGGAVADCQPGHVAYFAPDTLEWMSTEMGHAEWVSWTLTGDVPAFYADLRWTAWRTDVETLTPDQGLALYSFPWTAEGKTTNANVSRRPVPLTETWGVTLDIVRQLNDGQGP